MNQIYVSCPWRLMVTFVFPWIHVCVFPWLVHGMRVLGMVFFRPKVFFFFLFLYLCPRDEVPFFFFFLLFYTNFFFLFPLLTSFPPSFLPFLLSSLIPHFLTSFSSLFSIFSLYIDKFFSFSKVSYYI